MYYCNDGPKSGPILCRHRIHALGVLESRDNNAPIGMALPVSRDDDLVERWRLVVHDAEVPGVWVVVDREFRPAPAHGDGRGPRP
jgi:hypothetical protein